jgi:Family of unknown function (DUF6151)
MNCPLRCRCGLVQGAVDVRHSAGRALCYCKDCQAFARFLQRESEILDHLGGTEIIATVPRRVRFNAGFDKVVCMSLSENGLLRWYASCCRTPIGNTPRDRKISYVGLVRACLAGSDDEIRRWFGPLEIALNAQSARGEVRSTPMATFVGVLKIIRNVAGARLNGGYKDNAFFAVDSGAPTKVPKNLTLAERRALDSSR